LGVSFKTGQRSNYVGGPNSRTSQNLHQVEQRVP